MKTWFKDNVLLLFFGFFAFAGTVFGIVAFAVWQDTEKSVRQGIRAEGKVVRYVYGKKGALVAPVIEFESEWGGRQTHVSSTFSNPPEFQIGERVQLWYDPANPENVVLPGADRWLLPGIFGGFFVIFGGIGFGGMLWRFRQIRRKNWLLQNGQPVEAAFIGVSQKTSVRVGGSSPFVVQCQWFDPASRHVFVFESDYVWYNPVNFLNGSPLRVLIDPQNPKSHLVDLSFLPEIGN